MICECEGMVRMMNEIGKRFLACETFITEDAIHDSALGIYPLWSWGVKIAKFLKFN